ncbi:hypothetical protein [Oceaniglobus ichthyenteri]|uniref:hypothetical protein n=1 Tax=Oceaniglobus ichthyenteri TaxID=2136177 RepID=UPI000D3562A8|nr:hypothetical protein [Oceaniglobus ichthyenteri]
MTNRPVPHRETQPHPTLENSDLPKAALAEDDLSQIEQHLNMCDIGDMSVLPSILRHKMQSAKRLTGDIPDDVVIGGSRVIYAVDRNPAQSGLLSHRARAGNLSGVIPVTSPLGATLIGMSIGQTASLTGADGTVTTVSVLGVAQHG